MRKSDRLRKRDVPFFPLSSFFLLVSVLFEILKYLSYAYITYTTTYGGGGGVYLHSTTLIGRAVP